MEKKKMPMKKMPPMPPRKPMAYAKGGPVYADTKGAGAAIKGKKYNSAAC